MTAHRPTVEVGRFAAWEDGRLVSLVADGPDLAEETREERETRLRAAGLTDDELRALGVELVAEDAETLPDRTPPAQRTPADQTYDAPADSVPFTIPVCVLEGYVTSDDRRIAVDALGHEALPQSLMVMTRNPDGGWGHAGAFVGGRVDTLERFDASGTINPQTSQPYGPGVSAWRATGHLYTALGPNGENVVQMVRDRVLSGVSVDVGEAAADIEVIEEDEDGWPTRVLETVTEGSIMGMTVCPFPAFPGAYIELDGEDLPEPDTAADPEAVLASGVGVRLLAAPGCRTCDGTAEVLVAAGGPAAPPAAWFEMPPADLIPQGTGMTYTAEGRVYGYVAEWGTCHTGMTDRCVTPPRSGMDYGLFHAGVVRTAEGTDVPVGQITLGTGHADARLGLSAAVEHYDNTGTAAVDVHLYENEVGIVAAGALRPNVSEEDVRALRATGVSGDWRGFRGGLELIGVLSVNVSGFPVVARVASGAPVSLVAAGAVQRRETRDQRPDGVDLNAVVAAAVRPMLPLVREHHLARLRKA